MDAFIGLLQTAGAFVVAIYILVAIHEYGHFYAARKLGFKVEKLSIGFGKALLSWKSKDGEVEYVFAAIPLGGYVKMLGESSGESLKKQDDTDLTEEDKARSYEMMPIWKRAIVAFAGPFFNIAFAVILYMIIGWIGQSTVLPITGNVVVDSPAYEAGIRKGDRIVSINNKTINSWKTMEESIRNNVNKEIDVEFFHGKEIERSHVKLNKTKKDPMLSDASFEAFGIYQSLEFFVDKVTSGSAAEKAGVEKGKIISINGDSLTSTTALLKSIKDNAGSNISIDILTKNKEIKTFKVNVDKENPVIGIVFNFKSSSEKGYHQLGFVDGISYGFTRTWDITIMLTKGIGKLFNGDISTEYISGPITIAQISERSMSAGFVSFLVFLAIISLNLGIMNLLPVPVLDGGHLIFLAIEKIKGASIEPIILEKVQYTGLGLVLCLMVFAMYNDMIRIFS